MSHAPASPPADPLSSPNAASARSAPPTTPHYLGPSHTHPAPAPAPAQAPAPEPVDRRWDHCTTPGPRLTLALTVARQTQLDAAAPPEPPAPEQPGPEARARRRQAWEASRWSRAWSPASAPPHRAREGEAGGEYTEQDEKAPRHAEPAPQPRVTMRIDIDRPSAPHGGLVITRRSTPEPAP